MSKKDAERIAKLMGAKVVGKVGRVGPGVFAAWRLAKIYEDRMNQLRRQGAPSDTARLQLSISAPVAELLQQVATEASEALGQPMESKDVARAILEAALLEATQTPGR